MAINERRLLEILALDSDDSCALDLIKECTDGSQEEIDLLIELFQKRTYDQAKDCIIGGRDMACLVLSRLASPSVMHRSVDILISALNKPDYGSEYAALMTLGGFVKAIRDRECILRLKIALERCQLNSLESLHRILAYELLEALPLE